MYNVANTQNSYLMKYKIGGTKLSVLRCHVEDIRNFCRKRQSTNGKNQEEEIVERCRGRDRNREKPLHITFKTILSK